MENKGILTLCINCQQNRNPNCTKCVNRKFDAYNHKYMSTESRTNQRSKDLYLRQLDNSQISHMGLPNILDDRNLFDLNTRLSANESNEESAKNDILFSRIITSSSENRNKFDDYKSQMFKKVNMNPRLDFGLYTEPCTSQTYLRSEPITNKQLPNIPFTNEDRMDIFSVGQSTHVRDNESLPSGSHLGNHSVNPLGNHSVNPNNSDKEFFQTLLGQGNPERAPMQNDANVITKKNNSDMISELINVFSVNIMSAYYQILSKKKIIFSPYLLFNFLYAFLRGSYGETEKEIENMLLFENINKNDIFTSIIDTYKLVTNSPYIMTVNILITNINIPIRSQYYKLINSILNLIMINTKFFQNEMNEINTKIKTLMKGTISDIITINTFSKINPQAFSMAVVQSMYFYAPWKYQFDERNTKKEFFLQKDSNHIIIEMMNMFNTRHHFVQYNDQQLIEMEYSDENYRFGCYLRDNINNDAFVEYENISLMVSKLQKVVVKLIKLPKFTQKSKFFVDELYKKILPSNSLFTNVDIPYITTSKNLAVNRIIQYTIMSINEKGNSIAPISNENLNITFSANRPFIYYVRHILTNTFVLMGSFE